MTDSATFYGVAHVSSVDLHTSAPGAAVGVGSPAVDGSGQTVAALSADGLLTFRPSLAGSVVIADGETVKAIRPVYSDGTAISSTDYEAVGPGGTNKLKLLLLRAEDGGAFTLVHDAAPPIDEWDAEERIYCQYGRDVVLGNSYIYLQWERLAEAPAARGWRAADWGGYVATTPGDWSVEPTTVWSALDTVASDVSTNASRTVAMPGLIDLSVMPGSIRMVYRGPTATLTGISAVLDGGLTALSTVTLDTFIDGLAVTDGDITITAAGAGTDTVHSATPSAANDLVDGDVIRVDCDPETNMLTTKAAITLLIQPT